MVLDILQLKTAFEYQSIRSKTEHHGPGPWESISLSKFQQDFCNLSIFRNIFFQFCIFFGVTLFSDAISAKVFSFLKACCSVVHRRFWLLPKSNHYPRRWFCLRRPPPYRSSKKQAYSLVFESQYCVYGSTGWEIPSSFQRSKRYAQSLNGAERQPF